jgi:hypothetical protein
MFESLNEFVLSMIVLLAGGVTCLAIGRWLGLRPVIIVLMYAWHTAFGFYYSNYVLVNGGDAFGYYLRARYDFVELGFGTEFIVWLTSIPVSLGLSYWPVALLYNVIGATGVLFIYKALSETQAVAGESKFGKLLVFLCVFVPSFNFWTAGIGKDAIACFSVGLFLWSTMSFERRQPATIGAILVMLLIRPHMAVLMVVSVAIGALFAAEVRGSIRVGVAALATIASIFAVPMALAYAGTARFASIGEYINDRQEQNLGGGSSIDLIGMNPVLRLFSFLYRPLPNEANGIDQLAASMDNVLLIGFTLMAITWIFRAGAVRLFRANSMVILYALMGIVLLSQVTANLGLATRQKWMMLPAIMLIFISAWGMARQAAAKKRQPRRPMIAAAPRALR